MLLFVKKINVICNVIAICVFLFNRWLFFSYWSTSLLIYLQVFEND